MIGYGIPEAEIRLLIKHPQTGKRIVGSILGRDGGLQDDRARVMLATLFAKAWMGWTTTNRHQLVHRPIDHEDAERELDAKLARLARRIEAQKTGGSSGD